MNQGTDTEQGKTFVKADGDIAEVIKSAKAGEAVAVDDIDDALAADGVPSDDTEEEEMLVLRTGFDFKGADILLETDDPELLDQFKRAWHRLERAVFGDYQ